jgi:serine/threonine protein kinase/WD40 repeat protein
MEIALSDSPENEVRDQAPWFELPSDLPRSGQVVGHYRLLEEIARGGMGIIYRALQEGSQRIVALKMILPHQQSTPEMIARFQAEREIVASLDHPHILPIYEIGEADGIPYYTMKLAENGSLIDYARKLRGRIQDIARFMSKVASAVHYAHQRGVLHRDLKPANILLDQNFEPLVCDFGLARRLEEDKGLTVSRAVLGTPHYLSPEQARGEGMRLTTSSDIFSLGTILYELLVWYPPFVGTDPIAVMRQVAEATPAKPSAVRFDIPRDLEVICLHCLEKDPQHRYPSALALANDLDRWLEGRSILARPAAPAEQLWRWTKRNPILASVCALLAFALIGIAIGSALVSISLKETLWHSYLAQARSTRLTGLSGQRFGALEVLARAGRIRPALELRNEAAGALALTDLKVQRSWEAKPNVSSPLVFDTNLERYAVAERPGTISIRRVSDQSEVRRIQYDGPAADALIPFSKENRFLGMMDEDDGWTFWDLSEEPAKVVFRSKGIPRGTRILGIRLDAAFSPQAPTVAVGQPDGGLTIFNLLTGLVEKHFTALDVPATLAFDPAGARIAVGLLHQKRIVILDAATANQNTVLQTQNEPISLAWDRSGTELVSGERHGTIEFFDPVQSKRTDLIEGTDNSVSQLIYNASGDYLLTTAFDSEIRIWDARNHVLLNRLRDWGLAPSLRLSEKEDLLACSEKGTKAALLDLNLSPVWYLLHDPKKQEKGSFKATLSISHDGSLLACGFNDAIRLYDLEHHTLVATIPIDSNPTNQFNEVAVAFVTTRQEEALLVSSRKNGLSRWPLVRNLTAQVQLGFPQILDQSSDCVMASAAPDGKLIVLLQPESGQIRIWQQNSPTDPIRIAERPNILEALISPDGHWLATTIYDPFQHNNTAARIWDINSHSMVQQLPGTEGAGALCIFSPDADLLAIAGEPGVMVSGPSWRDHLPIPQPAEAQAYAFSNNKSLLAVVLQHQIKIYSFPQENELLTLEVPNGLSTSFAQLVFSPDDSELAVFYLEGSVQLWEFAKLRTDLRQIGLDWGPPMVTPTAQMRSHQ